MSEVIVVGGGAAGMMAAIAAADCGHQVTIIEKNEKLGKKLFITGKGRCNITNSSDMDVLFNSVMTNRKFLYSAFYAYDNQMVIDFFEQMVRIGKDDVIIGISFPRYSMRTLKAMEFANNRNAKVITLTDSVHSPMNLYSSCNLIADSDMASIVDSLVAPLSVINALIVALCMKNRKKVAKTLEMLEDIWDEYQVYESDEINYIDDSIKMRYGKIGDTEFNE